MRVGIRPPREAGVQRPLGGEGQAGRTRIRLLGGFELCVGRVNVRLPLGVERLIAFLALQDRTLLRHYVAGSLWPETTEDRASANLRSSLWRIRRAGYPVVVATSTSLRLRTDVAVDVRDMVTLVRDVPDFSADLPDHCLERIQGSGDLLPGWYEDWVAVERERLRQLRLHALEALGQRLAAAGSFGAAIEAGLSAVAAEPLRESAHRVLIKTYLAEGNQGEAIREYERYRRLLHEELRLKPSRQMEELVAGLGAR